MIEPREYDDLGVAEGYNAIIDLLLGSGLNKAEAIVALLNVIATQYAGELLSDDDARLFVEDASDWIQNYFAQEILDAKTAS